MVGTDGEIRYPTRTATTSATTRFHKQFLPEIVSSYEKEHAHAHIIEVDPGQRMQGLGSHSASTERSTRHVPFVRVSSEPNPGIPGGDQVGQERTPPHQE